jgi:hypothetical protein
VAHDTNLTSTEQALKQAFIKARGYWRPWTEAVAPPNDGGPPFRPALGMRA